MSNGPLTWKPQSRVEPHPANPFLIAVAAPLPVLDVSAFTSEAAVVKLAVGSPGAKVGSMRPVS